MSSRLEVVGGADKQTDVFLMAEVMVEATYVRHHVKKIAFLFSAMRHFAEALRSAGYAVRYEMERLQATVAVWKASPNQIEDLQRNRVFAETETSGPEDRLARPLHLPTPEAIDGEPLGSSGFP